MRQPVVVACQRPAADRIRLLRAFAMTHSKTIQLVFHSLIFRSLVFRSLVFRSLFRGGGAV